MLHSTRGIVFHTIKYSETSIIVKIYTGLFGIQSYLIKGIRKSKSKSRAGLFQPMTLLDLVVYHRERHSLQSVKEVTLAHPFKTLPFDIRKSSIALFINELIYKAIREEEANPDLFRFLWQTILTLDSTEEGVSSFHISFTVQLMHHLASSLTTIILNSYLYSTCVKAFFRQPFPTIRNTWILSTACYFQICLAPANRIRLVPAMRH